MYTEENLAPRKIKMDLNEKTGQTVLIRCRARPDKPTDQQTVKM